VVAPPDSGEVPGHADQALDFLDPPEKPEYIGRLGHFHVVGVIGRGGMGVVLKAHDVCLQRYVALKVLDPQYAKNERAQERFCREARSAASISHEHVVAIHQVEYEEEKDLPYLVMQFVPGESLQDRLDRTGPLELGEILRIGYQTAAGLAAAHAQGLIHRDVKPANILLESAGERVRLTDFGLARAAEDVRLTQSGFIAGTPLFMAPEQARGETVDHRADLFSLGSVLYAMCTGQPPFDGSTPFVVLKKVTEELPKPIREINPEVPEWLAAMIGKLQAKRPEDRYQSAAEVADVLKRELLRLKHGCPAATAPPAPPARTRRQRWLGLGLVAGVALAAAFGGMAVAEATGASKFLAALLRPGPAGQPGTPEEPAPAARATLPGNAGPIWSVAISPDGGTLAMAIDDGSVKLWDLKEGRVKGTLTGHAGPIWAVGFSPDGTGLATASDDGTAKLWDLATGKETRSLEHPTAVRRVAFAPDGKRLATGSRNGVLRVWDLTGTAEPPLIRAHPGVIMSLAFSPDGKTVATASSDKTVKLWDAATGQAEVTLTGHAGGVYAVAFAPDGKTVASGGWDKTARLWDVATGNPKGVLQGHAQDVWGLAFAPDGKTLATASEDRTVKLWDLTTGKERVTWKEHTGTVYAVAFAPDGKTVASAGRDGTVKLWEVPAKAGD
jgi:Tol biopolymer transport system component